MQSRYYDYSDFTSRRDNGSNGPLKVKRSVLKALGMTYSEYLAMLNERDRILKEDGQFKEIEFSDNLFRNNLDRKPVVRKGGNEAKFRMYSICGWHNENIPPKIREAFILIGDGIYYDKAAVMVGIPKKELRKWTRPSVRKLREMLDFVRKMDEEAEND